MFVAKTIAEISQKIRQEKLSQKKIAFVPTMGALHAGHLSLVEKAKKSADIVVVSLFVNKAQFNDLGDYQKYPRLLSQDLQLLENCAVDFVFAPDDREIYPDSEQSFKIVATKYVDCLCGATRPGHFDGVALVVAKLLNIVNPDVAIFGQKDFQQVLVIKKLVQDLNFKVEILTQETLREKSGLAMSSRNSRLDEDGLKKAENIFRILSEIKLAMKNGQNILAEKSQELLKIGFEKIDYLEIRDEENLQLVDNEKSAKNLRIFIAVYLQGVRLIDNLKI